MPLSAQHKAGTRRRIVAAAGHVFRRRGAESPTVDELMAAAGLTRGGFYAHFDSKQALLAEVLATDHGLIRHLSRREAGSTASWLAQTRQVFADYLNADHLAEVATGCTFAALAAEAARADEAAREGFRASWRRAQAEVLRRSGESWRHALQRASPVERAKALLMLSTAIGAVQQAAALGDGVGDLARQLLRAAAAQVDKMCCDLHRGKNAGAGAVSKPRD
jgi:TetR/AcrR family transcriptional regulator, transcriptional repressor for nem operon